MIFCRLRHWFVACTGAACLGIAALAPPVSAQVFSPEGGRPRTPQAALKVTGLVTDAGGKPHAGAQVVVVTAEYAHSARPMGIWNGRLPLAIECHGPATSDDQGRFELVVPPCSSGVYSELRSARRGTGAWRHDRGLAAGIGKSGGRAQAR